ncbi:MAG: DUF192 domain-containing protein [Phycisphaerales bacterium]|nr:MAG: DUF192 domain-containing protein [Phycisphaerales bacterium]
MKLKTVIVGLSAVGVCALTSGCPRTEPNRLDTLPKVRMTIKGQRFELWVAHSLAEQNKGLMRIKREDMAPLSDGTKRGMLFVFDYSTRQSFWMKNTLIRLDIAYITNDGTVVGTHTMEPMDTRHNKYPAEKPYRYAIEVNAGVLKELGVGKGDHIDIPASVLKDKS